MPLKKSQNPHPEAAEEQLVKEFMKPTKPEESSPKDGSKPKRLPFRRYFDAVREDAEVLVEALKYYNDVVEDGRKHITTRGNLEVMTAETPGLAYFYRGVRTDAQQIRRWLEKRLEATKGEKFVWFHSDPEAIKKHGTLKITEITKYVDADEDIVSLNDFVRGTAEAEHRLEDMMEGFEERRLALARITEIRKEGLKEVWISDGDDNA